MQNLSTGLFIDDVNGDFTQQSTHTYTIDNDDEAELSINDVTLLETNSGTVNAVFTVTLTGSVPAGLSVDFDTANGTATTADSDYVANSGTLNFTGNNGETQTITILVNGDTTVEADETFNIELSNITSSLSGSIDFDNDTGTCLLYTSPSPRDRTRSRMPSSA